MRLVGKRTMGRIWMDTSLVDMKFMDDSFMDSPFVDKEIVGHEKHGRHVNQMLQERHRLLCMLKKKIKFLSISYLLVYQLETSMKDGKKYVYEILIVQLKANLGYIR